MPKAKVEIQQDTARYYLQLETAFARLLQLATKFGVNPADDNVVLWAATLDPNLGYMYRTDLHDNLQVAARKRDPGLQKNLGVSK